MIRVDGKIAAGVVAVGLCFGLLLAGCAGAGDAGASSGAAELETVDFRDGLRNTSADRVADFFANGVTDVVATDYCVTPDPKVYRFDDAEKLSELRDLLSGTTWGELTEPLRGAGDSEGPDMTLELKNGDETAATIRLLSWVVGSCGVVELAGSGKTETFEIPERTYRDMRAFPTQTYYLHKSSLEPPTQAVCLQAQENALRGLDAAGKKTVAEKTRSAHYTLESLLLENVSYLKEPDSTAWELAITGHGQNVETGAFSFDGVAANLRTVADALKDAAAKRVFEALCADLQKACEQRDVGKIFELHEILHDYDYFAINYPAHYDLTEPADWGGIDVYFGHLSGE